MILFNILLLLVGFVLLIKGADIFVEQSSLLAQKLKIPPLIVGLTIVAMGTSAPELAVSISAAVKGSADLAVGNVVGSNMFNLLAVLGICSMIQPSDINGNLLKRDFPVCLGATVLFILFVMNGTITRPEAAVLLAGIIIYITVSVIAAKKEAAETECPEPEGFSGIKCAGGIILGLAGIVLGGDLVVNNAKTISVAAGMSETLAGLTICAVGTSLPELVTSITAAKKGQNDMALGNVVGSNLFNILMILGVSGVIVPISADPAALTDGIILLAASVLVYIFCLTGKKVTKAEGGFLALGYAAYMAFIIIRNYM